MLRAAAVNTVQVAVRVMDAALLVSPSLLLVIPRRNKLVQRRLRAPTSFSEGRLDKPCAFERLNLVTFKPCEWTYALGPQHTAVITMHGISLHRTILRVPRARLGVLGAHGSPVSCLCGTLTITYTHLLPLKVR